MPSHLRASPRRVLSDTGPARTAPSAETLAAFRAVNDREVDQITLDVFYKPHTVSLLVCCIVGITCIAFFRHEYASPDYRSNVFAGLCSVLVFFLIISVLAFPNGPFIRPHPILWRMVFGLSVMYLLTVQFLIHQDYATVKSIIVWFDPRMANYSIDAEKEYGVDCNNVTLERLWSHFDWFAFGHYWGWGMKALIIRHYGICWSISVMWELTEMAFGHLLPNFYECWWDNLVLDVLLCNGLGIFTGMMVCRFFEMREHHWESFKNISTRTGRIKRALLQFTPESWSHTRWLDPSCSWMRLVAVSMFMVIWQVVELNTFFVKHIFPMPTEHPLCVARILLMGLMAAPATRQYYSYITDKQCKRLGSQAWVFLCITLSELVLNIKFGLEDLFSKTQMSMMILWIITCVAISCVGVFVSMAIYRRRIGDFILTVDEKDQVVKEASSHSNNHQMNNAESSSPYNTRSIRKRLVKTESD